MTWLRHPLAFLAFTLFAGLFSLSLYSSWRRTQSSAGQVTSLENQVQQMSESVKNLKNEVKTASSAANQERIIRDELLMQKPGESVLQIPEITADNTLVASPSPSPTTWQAWQELLLGS